jgi:hypothetical protein
MSVYTLSITEVKIWMVTEADSSSPVFCCPKNIDSGAIPISILLLLCSPF